MGAFDSMFESETTTPKKRSAWDSMFESGAEPELSNTALPAQGPISFDMLFEPQPSSQLARSIPSGPLAASSTAVAPVMLPTQETISTGPGIDYGRDTKIGAPPEGVVERLKGWLAKPNEKLTFSELLRRATMAAAGMVAGQDIPNLSAANVPAQIQYGIQALQSIPDGVKTLWDAYRSNITDKNYDPEALDRMAESGGVAAFATAAMVVGGLKGLSGLRGAKIEPPRSQNIIRRAESGAGELGPQGSVSRVVEGPKREGPTASPDLIPDATKMGEASLEPSQPWAGTLELPKIGESILKPPVVKPQHVSEARIQKAVESYQARGHTVVRYPRKKTIAVDGFPQKPEGEVVLRIESSLQKPDTRSIPPARFSEPGEAAPRPSIGAGGAIDQIIAGSRPEITSTGRPKPARPTISIDASKKVQEKQARAQQAWDQRYAPKGPREMVTWKVAPKSVARKILKMVDDATYEQGPGSNAADRSISSEDIRRFPSMKPTWVQDTGITYEKLREVVQRVLDGKPITRRQSDALGSAYEGAKAQYIRENETGSGLGLTFQREATKAMRAAEAERVRPKFADDLQEGQQVRVGDEWLDVKKQPDGTTLLEDGVTIELVPFDDIPGEVRSTEIPRTEMTPAGEQGLLAGTEGRRFPTEPIRNIGGRVRAAQTQGDVFQPEKIKVGNLPQDQTTLFGKSEPVPLTSGGKGLDQIRQKHLAELGEDQGGIQEVSGGLGAVGTAVSRAVTPKVRTRYTPDQVAGSDNVVRDFFDRTEKAATNPVRNLWQSLKEETKKRFVPFYKLRGAKKLEYADTRNDLRLLQDAGERSMRDAIDHMRGMIGRVDKSQVDLLRRKVFVEDLLETMDKGKKVPEGLDEVNLGQEKVRLDNLINADPDLSAAYKRHGEVWDAVRQELIDRGRLDEATAYRNYVHHDVLDFFSEHGLNPTGKLRSPKRAYLGKREGSARDILTDYLAVQYRSLSRVLRDNAVDDGLISIAKRHHRELVKDEAIPDGYVEWTPGIAIEGGKTISGQMSARMFSRMMSEVPSDIRAEVVKLIEADRPRQKIKTFNIPVELAETLDSFRGDFISPTTGAVARATSMWKQMMLNKNPLRYNRRNMLGDFERAANAMPQAFGLEGMKEMRQTIREVIDAAKGKYSDDYKLAIENDVVGTGQVAREIGDLRQLEEFMHLADGTYQWKHPVRTIGRGLRNVSVVRENILRYHLLRTNLLRIRAGKPLLQGAADVRGMTDPIKAAGKIARETLGDYGNLTAWEIKQRRTLVPFYSWLKINTTFWPTLFARQGGAAVVRSGAIRGSMFIARKVAQATALYAAAQAWNEAMQGEQEAELPEYVRRRFHINTGMKNDKGEWITITDPTAFSDFMQTTGLEGIYPDTRALLRGDMSIWDFIGERAKQPVNALVQRITPFIKAPVEAATGKQLFPDTFNPKPGEKGVKGLIEGLGFREFTSPEKVSKSYGDQFSPIGMVGGKAIDPGSAALSDTYEITRRFLGKKGYSREGVSEGPDTDKKRDLFRALSDGDTVKAQRLVSGVNKDKFREYLDNRAPYHIPERGPREGLRTMNGIPNALQREFWASLSKEDRERILRAQFYIAKIRKMYSGLTGGR